jgi:hypothetical protein
MEPNRASPFCRSAAPAKTGPKRNPAATLANIVSAPKNGHTPWIAACGVDWADGALSQSKTAPVVFCHNGALPQSKDTNH